MAVRIGVHRFDIKAAVLVPRTIDIADGGDLDALPVHEERADGTDIAEALYDHGEILHVLMILFAPCFQRKEQTAARRFISAEGAAYGKRLAGDDTGLPLAGECCVFIGDPRHDLAIRIHIRCRYVLIRSDDGIDLSDIAACQTGKFAGGELVRIDLDPALCAAIRDIADGILDGHPRGKGFDFVFIGCGMETDAALRCASCGGVLYAVAGEDFDMPVIHLYRDAHGELALRIADKCVVALPVA